jgi:hypothetical protein
MTNVYFDLMKRCLNVDLRMTTKSFMADAEPEYADTVPTLLSAGPSKTTFSEARTVKQE